MNSPNFVGIFSKRSGSLSSRATYNSLALKEKQDGQPKFI
jgi:hypothetical protein